MNRYRIDYSLFDWESPMEGVRHKVFSAKGKRLRLVEYTPAMQPHWCEKGHIGYILDGRLEIEFPQETFVFESGDGLFIPDGPAHRHMARALSDVVRAVFVEDA
ncbi:MAG: AraC family ligand binding domain-containing protein [Thermodesulfobacteriota bacterium]